MNSYIEMVGVIIYAYFRRRKYWEQNGLLSKGYMAPSNIIGMSILIDFLRYYMAMGKFLIVYSYCFGWTNYTVIVQFENSIFSPNQTAKILEITMSTQMSKVRHIFNYLCRLTFIKSCKDFYKYNK